MATIVFEYGHRLCPNCKEITLHRYTWEVVNGGLPLIELRRRLRAARCTKCGELNPLTQKTR